MTFDPTAFLAELKARPFTYGHCDCALVIADLWRSAHGVDPASHLRGLYSDEQSCQVLLKQSGHLPILVARIAAKAGAKRVKVPKPGDFAVIRHQGSWFGAIRSKGGRWAVKCHDGLALLRNPRIVAMWGI